MTQTESWRVLVVEDEPDGQAVLTGIFDHFQIAWDAVDDAEAAIQCLRRSRYSAAVIDLGLPGMDGIELMAVIRQNADTAQLPCVAITAYHASSVKHQALAAGFNAYVPKPLDHAGLVNVLGRIISSARP